MSDMKTRLAAIRALEDRFGRVTAERLLKAASDKRHPMHDDFEWDDQKAAHEYRLNLARVLIASVRVVVTDVSKKIAAPAYVRDPNAGPREQGYVATSQLRNERDAAHEALLAEAMQLQGRLDRMRQIAAVLDLADELDAVIESVMTLASRLRRGAAPAEAEIRVGT